MHVIFIYKEKRRPSYTKHNELKAKRNFLSYCILNAFFELDIQNSQFFIAG